MKPFLYFIIFCVVFTACKKDKKKPEPQVSVSVSSQAANVIFNGQLQNIETTNIKEVGFVWNNTSSISITDGTSFKYSAKASTNFNFTATSGFVKDSIYYVKAYYLDNTGIYHYSNVSSFTSSGTTAATVSFQSYSYTWDELAKMTITPLDVTDVNYITITINGAVSLHPTKIDGTSVYFKIPGTLTAASNYLTASVYGQKSNTVPLYLAPPHLTSARNITYNDTMTITGKYFNPQLTLNKVKIGDVSLDVVSGDTSKLLVKLSSLTISENGPLTITTGTNLSVTSNGTYNAYRYFKPINNFPGGARIYATAQSMNNKLYYGLGSGPTGQLSDWWEYDPATNKWTQLADYPATAWYMQSFVLANRVYVGMGIVGGGYSSGFYAYDRVSNRWTMTAQHPKFALAPTVISNSKYAYMVGGSVRTPDALVRITDVWRYDPVADSWKKMGNFPGIAREGAMSFSAPEKGYVVGGNGTGFQPELKDTWEFDFKTEKWKQAANIPDEAGNEVGFAFALNNKGYIGGGAYNSVAATSTYVYEYDPVANTWTKKERILDSIVYGAVATSVNNTGYVLGGYKYYTPSVGDGSKSFISFTP